MRWVQTALGEKMKNSSSSSSPSPFFRLEKKRSGPADGEGEWGSNKMAACGTTPSSSHAHTSPPPPHLPPLSSWTMAIQGKDICWKWGLNVQFGLTAECITLLMSSDSLWCPLLSSLSFSFSLSLTIPIPYSCIFLSPTPAPLSVSCYIVFVFYSAICNQKSSIMIVIYIFINVMKVENRRTLVSLGYIHLFWLYLYSCPASVGALLTGSVLTFSTLRVPQIWVLWT